MGSLFLHDSLRQSQLNNELVNTTARVFNYTVTYDDGCPYDYSNGDSSGTAYMPCWSGSVNWQYLNPVGETLYYNDYKGRWLAFDFNKSDIVDFLEQKDPLNTTVSAFVRNQPPYDLWWHRLDVAEPKKVAVVMGILLGLGILCLVGGCICHHQEKRCRLQNSPV